ncbi:hypothetical protein [Acidithiobacillus sp.]|uniref:hypothetical protein n=1 Tax=Acidithiobacillus sp. TaxID=1872118 RepID=UPI002612C108|nr:hypothetical protein [Acidithiobacillus sp.]
MAISPSVIPRDITGAVLPIKTGAALAVDLDEDSALSGKLRWYAHPKALAGLADR